MGRFSKFKITGRRRRNGRNGAKSTRKIAKTALRRTVMNRPEMKAITYTVAMPDICIVPTFQHLTHIDQGDDSGERVGREARVVGIQYTLYVVNALAALGSPAVSRIMIFQDK